MRIAICDDDLLMQQRLHALLKTFFERRQIPGQDPEIEVFSNGDLFVESSFVPDLALLDIDMPGRNGIETAGWIRKHYPDCMLMMITGYDQYLDDATHIGIFSYISKPLDENRFLRNMDAFLTAWLERTQEYAVETEQGLLTLSSNDIIMIHYVNRKCVIVTTHGEYPSARSIRDWLRRLPSHAFFQTSRDAIIHFRYVKVIEEDAVRMNATDLLAPLSFRRHGLCKKNFLLYKAKKAALSLP